MARTGRPAKPIELHNRQGTYRPDRHGPKPMLASPPLARPSLVYTVPFDDHQYVARTALRFFQVTAAFSSECAIVMVASMSMTNPAARSGSAPDAHARSRAAARAATTAGRCTSSMR
jgi:hypothetical protein